MTEYQIELVRHALGLKDNTTTAYRNHFNTDEGSWVHSDWDDLVSKGLAVKRQFDWIPGSIFHVTKRCAEMVLREGESLGECKFPQEQATA